MNSAAILFSPHTDYDAIPVLPPSLMQFQNLPMHAKMIRSFSEMDKLSSMANRAAHFGSKGAPNVRAFDPRIFNLPPIPSSQVTPSVEETDSASLDSMRKLSHSSASSDTSDTSLSLKTTPQHSTTHSHPGTPVIPDRGKRSGGLQRAISRYQESKRKNMMAKRSSERAQTPQSVSTYGQLAPLSLAIEPSEARKSTSAGQGHFFFFA